MIWMITHALAFACGGVFTILFACVITSAFPVPGLGERSERKDRGL